MALKVTVKVSSITNLSDARYCAGMGVHMLGFVTVPGRAGYIPPKAFQDLRGWFAGPQVVAEVYGIRQLEELERIKAAYLPDLLEGGQKELPLLKEAGLPYILNVQASILENQHIPPDFRPAFLMTDTTVSTEALRMASQVSPVLIQLPDRDATRYLHLPVSGFVLTGGDEERPGLKDYDHLSSVLEQLECDASQ
jgi:phosphoribosylanthranilate isomerase